MRFRPKTRRIMAIAFAAIVIVIMVVPSTLPTVVGCVPRRGAPGSAAAGAGEKATLTIHAPNTPIASIAARLLPNQRVIVGAAASGGDPAYWKPSAEELARIQQADLVLLNGAGYEPWAEQAALPRARTVDLSRAVQSSLVAEEGETHSHGPEGEHSHAGFAFTTWLSPDILRAQAQEIALALAAAKPSRKPAIEEALSKLNEELLALGAKLRATAARQPLWLASHPVYQYLAQAGGTTVASMHWEPGEMPSEAEWTKFRAARDAAPKPDAVMLWEADPGAEIRAKLAAEGVRVAVFPPLGDGADFLGALSRSLDAMGAAVP